MKCLRILTVVSLMVAIAMPVLPASASTSPHAIVEKSADKVLSAVREARSSGEVEPSVFAGRLLELLGPVVDFDGIAKAVMGKHYKNATPDQRKAFNEAFKKTLSELYAKTLIKFKIDEVKVDNLDNGSDTRSRVAMEVKAEDGSEYKIIYSMRKNKEGAWVVRNVVLDGINVGLTYRNQFYSSARQHDGDLAKVIEDWSAQMCDDC